MDYVRKVHKDTTSHLMLNSHAGSTREFAPKRKREGLKPPSEHGRTLWVYSPSFSDRVRGIRPKSFLFQGQTFTPDPSLEDYFSLLF